MYPLNPGEVTDRQIAPSKAVYVPRDIRFSTSPPESKDMQAQSDCESIFEKRFNEGYDIYSEEYVAWLRVHHLESIPPNIKPLAPLSDDTPSNCSCETHQGTTSCKSVCSTQCSSAATSSSLSEILTLPKPIAPKRKRRQAINAKAQCITDTEVVQKLKAKQQEKIQKEKEKEVRKLERQRKKEDKEEKKQKKKLPQKKRQASQKKRGEVRRRSQKKVIEQFKSLSLIDETANTTGTDSEAECPNCGLVYGDDESTWIQCDGCGFWWDLKCSGICDSESVPDVYLCATCNLP